MEVFSVDSEGNSSGLIDWETPGKLLMLWSLVASVGLAVFSSGCTGVQEVHYLPAGYEGPVLIVFDAPEGMAPGRDPEGRVIYEIAQDGVLFINGPFPGDWKPLPLFYYKTGNAAPMPIPLVHTIEDAKPGVIQVFDEGGGASSIPEDVHAEPMRYIAYLVGRPENRDGLWSARERLIDRTMSRYVEMEGAVVHKEGPR